MRRITRMLSVAWIPLLGGCMTMGAMHGVGGMENVGHGGSGFMNAGPRRAEASGDPTPALSFTAPGGAAAVPIEATLRTEREHLEGTAGARVGGETHHGRRGWLMPAGLLGGLGMIIMMVLMIGDAVP